MIKNFVAFVLAGLLYPQISFSAPGDIISISPARRLSSAAIADNLRQFCPETVSKLGAQSILSYSIQYETVGLDGAATKASGAVAVPDLGTGPFSIVSYQRGTAINRFDVPSRGSREGVAISSCYGSQGYLVALPDYLGYGDSTDFHPYMHASTGATTSADFLRAVRNAGATIGFQLQDRLFLAGYSAGGHATMALHRYIESTLANEFRVTASAPMAGPYDMVNNFKTQVAQPSQFSSIQLGFLLWSWNKIYGWHSKLSDLISQPYVSSFDRYFGGTGDWSDVFSLHGVHPKSVIRPEALDLILNDPNSKIHASLKANNLYDWRPYAPINLYHGDKDINVPVGSSIIAHQTMTALGGNVSLTWIPGKDHQGAAPLAYAQSIQWFNSF